MAYIQPQSDSVAKIKCVGIGGGGQNAISSMIETNKVRGVEFIVMNTDSQVLDTSAAPIRIQLGPERTKGLGAGADPLIGLEAAQESIEEIEVALSGADMIFIAVCEGGGTGTGGAPVISKIAKETGALTIAVVTKPFTFEGKRRMMQAEEGIKQLKDNVDALIVIPNDRILEIVDEEVPFTEAFKLADEVIGKAVEGISDLITTTGLVNVDFADVKSVMNDAGSALMGIGTADGEGRAEKAAIEAINSPLLDVDIKGSTGILLNIVGDNTLTMHEVNTAARIVTQSSHDAANIILGASIDPNLKGIKVSVIATGFDHEFKIVGTPENGDDSDKILSRLESRMDILEEDNDSVDQKKSTDEDLSFFEKIKREVGDQDDPEVDDDSGGTNDSDFDPKEFDIKKLRDEVTKDDISSKLQDKSTDKKNDKKPESTRRALRDSIESSSNFWKNLPNILKEK